MMRGICLCLIMEESYEGSIMMEILQMRFFV